MSKIALIIPTRLDAKRLPNKPLKLINNKEMILHVYDLAKKSRVDEVLVATPDEAIAQKIKNKGGKAIITKTSHQTGTDRIYEVFKNELKGESDFIINLQGDKKKNCDIATLASKLDNEKDKSDRNVVKVSTKEKIIKNDKFSAALDFSRVIENNISNFIYHHIGIYAFTNKALLRYVSLERTKLETERGLEQLRALENKMKIDVGYVDQSPLSVDTENDLIEIKKLMERNVKN